MEQVCEKVKVVKKKKREKTKSSTSDETKDEIHQAPTTSKVLTLQLETPTADIDSCEEIIEGTAPKLENPETTETEVAEEASPLLTEQPKIESVADDYSKLNTNLGNLILEERTQSKIEQNTSAIDAVAQKPSKVVMKAYTESQLSGLYTNSELGMLDQFTSQFVEAELKGLAGKQHPLYDLLSNYLQVRGKIIGNSLELEQLRKEYGDLQETMWTTDMVTITGRGECQDGSAVTAVHSYQKATFHHSVFQSIVRILGLIRKLTHDNYVLYSFTAEDLHLQIELYIHTAIANCITVSGLDKIAPVILSLQDEPLHLKPYLCEIRLCISVLFAFQRKLIKDSQFLRETREWLSRLVAVLLRLATYQDHLFILSHILRCPAGVGSWASSFIQTPLEENLEAPFSNCQINHVLSILATILSPVKERDKFMSDLAQHKDNFVMVDSDGEEDEDCGTSLRENDLVALVTQLPLETLFRSVLLIENRNYQNRYQPHKVTQHHILRFFAFSTALLKLLNKGLSTYNQQRYNQFSKRLSRFIRHIVQYATDQWEQFRNNPINMSDQAMMERLAVEYDSFFLRAIYYLYTAQKLGAWQFLAVVPYNLIDIKTAWKIYYFLHDAPIAAKEILTPSEEDYKVKMWHPSFRQQFEEKLSSMADDELYYLLNTFANIALARESDDMDFIKSVIEDLLQMGFISANTREICSKTARTLLTHLTSKHPHLLSMILKDVRDNVKSIGSFVLYLYEELPLTVWKISDEDFGVISSWLLTNEIVSNESKLARMILSRLNWDLLPYDFHCDVAILVVRASEREPGYLNWAWQTILRLKLHYSDGALQDMSRILDPDNYEAIVKGIRQQQPLAIFVALLMTTWGHLIPMICSHGLQQLIFLQQNHQKHEAVLFVLYLLVPLFIDSQESIINDERFQAIIVNMICADRGYISMAKSLIGAQSTVLQQFGNMIETQIVNFSRYHLETPRCLVRLWMNSLVSIPGWNRDVGVMYLLDVVIRASFFHSDALDAAYNILRDLQQCNSSREQGGAFSSLFKWVSNTNSNGGLIDGSLANCPWLAYLIIDIEHEEREKRTGLWREIALKLDTQKGKVSVDGAIKKATSALKLPNFTSGYLCIYRWAQQAMDTPLDHPLLPLLWQKFFALYLSRSAVGGADNRACVGDMFFAGLVNFTFFKRIKARLQESLDFYQEKLGIYEDDDLEMKLFLEGCANVFCAFSLWLEEPKLQKNNLLLSSLPPSYQPELLAFIIQGDNTPWYVYLNYAKIKEDQSKCVKIWKLSNFRYESNVNKPLANPGGSMEDPDPSLRILRRLGVYESPKPPPEIKNCAPIVPIIDFGGKDAMFASLEPCFKSLKQFAHNHIMKVSEHKALDCSYQELIPQLYRTVLNKLTRKVPCKSRHDAVHCSGPAVIVLEAQEARINDRIEHQIQSNRNAFDSLLSKALQSPAVNLCTASVTIQQAIKVLQSQVKCNPASSELGCELFYYILSLINEETTTYLPTQTLFASCVEKLGRSHICGVEVEMPRLLEKILKEPNLGGYLAPHFSPVNVGSASLLFMYGKITKEIGTNYDVTFALLSKFDVDNWLSLKEPKSSHRSEFIRSVVKALTVLGFEPQIEALMLHGLYRRHLLSVFEFQFPEHYGEVLIQLLKASGGNSDSSSLVSKSVWLDVLRSLSHPQEIDPQLPLREQLRLYGHHQEKLQHQELLETAELFARHFTQERLQYGLYGLYPKCRNYVDIYALLLGMAGHGLIVSTFKVHEGLLGDELSQKIWPYLINIFAPWLVPYSMQNLKENMAAWIQQLADDRSVLLPWIPTDMNLAQKVVAAFFECVQFLIHTLPGCGNILSFVWQWYVTSFAHGAVKDHVLGPIHHSFVAFPWDHFWPTVHDVECMVRVVDQYLPESHSFLGHIFVSIRWSSWLGTFKTSPQPIKSRVYHCVLTLLVKLSNEPNVRNKYNNRAKSLLMEAEIFDWRVLEASAFQAVIDWFVMSCDPVVIFSVDPLNLDFRVLNCLKCVAEYDKPLESASTSNTQTKRLILVKSMVKLMSVYANKHKTSLVNKESELNAVMVHHLKHLEDVVLTQEEMDVLLGEYLGFVNIPNITKTSLKVFGKWISNKSGDGFVVRSLLKVTRTRVISNEALGFLMETTLTSYFQNNCTSNDDDYFNPTWKELGEIASLLSTKQTEFEQSLLSDGHILTLNAILIQRTFKWHETESLLNLAIDWISNLKVTESMESKVPLLWCEILKLSLLHCDKDEPGTGAILYKFAKTLLQLAEDKGGSRWGKGLLSVIGISKQDSVSVNFRFLCRSLAGYVLAQLPDMRGAPQSVRREAFASAKVGQPGGNSEAAKVLMSLDFGQSQGKIKECAELALKQIQDAGNSMHNAQHFLRLIVKQFYIKTYLKEDP